MTSSGSSGRAGRVAVVTGAGRGLGQAFALGLAERGDQVVAVARSEDQLRQTEHLAAGARGSVTGITCDVSDHRAVAASANDVKTRVGTPAILVNAAGIFGPIDLIRDADPEYWQRWLDD